MSKDKEILDVRGLHRWEQMRRLHDQYTNAIKVWESYDNVDPRLVETFKVLIVALEEGMLSFSKDKDKTLIAALEEGMLSYSKDKD